MARTKQARASRTFEAPTEEPVINKISLDELIPVMSLIDYPLNLMQQTNGKAKYRFDKFGQKKELLYQDVLTILENYQNFLEGGYFIILDKRVIDRHGLQETFSKILTKEQIEKILDGSPDAMKLYEACSTEQQQKIIGMITRKLVRTPDSVDMNLVSKISRLSGTNIAENVNDARENLKKEDDQAE